MQPNLGTLKNFGVRDSTATAGKKEKVNNVEFVKMVSDATVSKN
jgi:hypothetical protein